MRLLEDWSDCALSIELLLGLADGGNLLSNEGGGFDLKQVCLFTVNASKLLQQGQVLIEIRSQVKVIRCQSTTIVTHIFIVLRRNSLLIRNFSHLDAPKTVRVSGFKLESLTCRVIWVTREIIDC